MIQHFKLKFVNIVKCIENSDSSDWRIFVWFKVAASRRQCSGGLRSPRPRANCSTIDWTCWCRTKWRLARSSGRQFAQEVRSFRSRLYRRSNTTSAGHLGCFKLYSSISSTFIDRKTLRRNVELGSSWSFKGDIWRHQVKPPSSDTYCEEYEIVTSDERKHKKR